MRLAVLIAVCLLGSDCLACDKCQAGQQPTLALGAQAYQSQPQVAPPVYSVLVPSQPTVIYQQAPSNGNGNGAVIQPYLPPMTPPTIYQPVSASTWARLYFNAQYSTRKRCLLPGYVIRQRPNAVDNVARLAELKDREDRLQELQRAYAILYYYYHQGQVQRIQPVR